MLIGVLMLLPLEDVLAEVRGGGVIVNKLLGDIKLIIDGDCISIDGVDSEEEESSSKEKEDEVDRRYDCL